MKHALHATLAALGTLCTLGATLLPAGSAFAQAPLSLHVQPLDIIDRQGFEKPMVAYTIFVPARWRTEAAVQWTLQAPCRRAFQPVFKAEAPDGSAALQLLPGEGWGRSSMGGNSPIAAGCPVAVFASAEAYLQSWLQRHRPGAKLLELQPRPDKAMRPPPMQYPGMEARQVQDAAQALIEVLHQGQAQRERLVVVVQLNHIRTQGLNGGVIETQSGESGGVLAWRAPGAGPDQRAFDAVWSSFKRSAAWGARIQQGQQQMAAENAATQSRISQMQHQSNMQTLAEQAKRGEMAHQARQEMATMQQEGWRQGQASQDRQQQQRVQAVREVQSWRAADGSSVELPHHFRHAWKLKDGSYVLTDEAAFDPQRTLRMEGQALKPAR
jgi:hypothetical protein